MSTMHLFQIESLQTQFQGLLHLQSEIEGKQEIMKTNLASLKGLYGDLVKQNNKKIFLFCLDSFYFQYKTLCVELDNIGRFITMINNRMYGDYYKLYNIILMEASQTDETVQELMAEFKKFTAYKDLDPFHSYPNEEMIQLHKNILSLLNHLYVKYLRKEQDIVNYSEITTFGMGVGNFMHTLSFENTMVKEQLLLYVNYLQFFHKSQEKYLTKLFIRIEQFLKEVEEDILHHRGTGQTHMIVQSPLHEEISKEKEQKKKELEETISVLENKIEIEVKSESKKEEPKKTDPIPPKKEEAKKPDPIPPKKEEAKKPAQGSKETPKK